MDDVITATLASTKGRCARGCLLRLSRYIRETFLAEAANQDIGLLDQVNDLFVARAEQVGNGRAHTDTGQAASVRFEAGSPPRHADPGLLRETFRWSVTRKVARTATVPLMATPRRWDPALARRRVELRYDPEDLSRFDVFFDGKPAGAAVSSAPAAACAGLSTGGPFPPAPDRIDYLRMVAAARDEESGAGTKTDLARLAALDGAER